MKKIIYTKHAQERIKLRRLSPTSIEHTINDPDQVQDLGDGKKKFIKVNGTKLYHVVTQYLPTDQAWLVISVWIRGEEDPPHWLWWLISAPFRLLWWVIKLLFGWPSDQSSRSGQYR